MMKRFTVYDSKAECYMAPKYVATRGLFLREFIDLLKQPDSIFSKHPADFTVFEVGEWNEFTCEDKTYPAMVSLGTALELSVIEEPGNGEDN